MTKQALSQGQGAAGKTKKAGKNKAA